MRREKPIFSVVIDTREQARYAFYSPKRRDLADGGILTYALSEGDYSCELNGELLPIRIERKTIVDYFGVVGRGRERFERELERLRPYRSYLLIEATVAEVRHGIERSLVSGEAALGSALAWSAEFGVSPVFAGNRRDGRDICQRLLEAFAAHYGGEK